MLTSITDFLFPKVCLHCKTLLSPLESAVCVVCKSELSAIDLVASDENELENLFLGKICLESVVSSVYFVKGGVSQSILHALKYHGNKKIARFMALEIAKQLTKVEVTPDVVVPIPTTFTRKFKRGYNQAQKISGELSKILECEHQPKILKRKGSKKSQIVNSKYERWKNVSDNFKLKKEGSLKGKHVLLLDDVITTGATIEACAQLFHTESSIKVSVASFAFAPIVNI